MSLAPGLRLGPYEILSPIGAGGMGEVYRARDTRLGRQVAIKVLPEAFAADPDRLVRFENEAKAVAALSHPNILAIFDYGSAGATSFAVTELLEGQTLRERLAAGPLSPKEAVDLSVQLVRGLAAAHEKGIVHRDIKPENLFITSHGILKILDFGLSRSSPAAGAAEGPTQSLVTSPGTVMGTMGYMSPEQARGLPLDSRTDLFSIGCVLYEMLSGHRAFAGETPADTLSALLLREPEPLAARCRDLPPALEAIAHRCLAKSVGDRFYSARQLLEALEAAAASPTASPAAPASPDRPSSGSRSVPSGSGTRDLSIVVLPFEDLSPGKDSEYFSDGLTEEILGDLSKIGSLRVISRTSSMALKGVRKDLRTLSSELGVHYVLEGSVRRAGNALRISAQLIDARADAHLWSEKYAGTLDDVFDIQEKVSRAITEALKVKLSPSEDRQIAARPITSIQAYDCFLKARQAMHFLTAEGIREAERLLLEGLALGGENALLYAGLARVRFEMVDQCMIGSEGLEQSEDYAQRALALDPELSTAHLALGLVEHFRGNLVGCMNHLDRALALDPNDGDILWWKTWFTAWNLGRTAEALPYAEKQMAIDPGNPLSHASMAYVDSCEGRFGEGYERFRAATPTLDIPVFRVVTATFLAWLQRNEEALAVLDPVEPVSEFNFYWNWGFLMKLALKGERARLPEAMTTKLVGLAEMDPCVAYLVGSSLAQLGLEEESLDYLEKSIRRGYINVAFIEEHDPFLSKIRGTPRFAALVQLAKAERVRFEAERRN
jgi:eukaryotic-like serine/threonine-protein kinase